MRWCFYVCMCLMPTMSVLCTHTCVHLCVCMRAQSPVCPRAGCEPVGPGWCGILPCLPGGLGESLLSSLPEPRRWKRFWHFLKFLSGNGKAIS